MIMHIDMDTFFVSVERLLDPSLVGKPVIIGGMPDERGVVAACSYEAREFGVQSAMPLRTAGKCCPQGVFMRSRANYRDYSRKVFAIIERYSPLVDKASVDEAYVDISGCLNRYADEVDLATTLQHDIEDSLGLPCSVGISLSPTVAKIASKLAKPAGVKFVAPGQEVDFLAPLDVSAIPGVGKVTTQKLHDRGIKTIRQLQQTPDIVLRSAVGSWGGSLLRKASGQDRRSITGESRTPKSLGHEITFREDVTDSEYIATRLTRLAEKVADRLGKHHARAGTLTLKLRDHTFETHDHAISFDMPTADTTLIAAAARTLLRRHLPKGLPIRLVGLRATRLHFGAEQLDLFEAAQRHHAVDDTVAQLRDRFGFDSISRADALASGSKRR